MRDRTIQRLLVTIAAAACVPPWAVAAPVAAAAPIAASAPIAAPAPTPAPAGDAQFQLPDREVYAGVPFRVLVRITDASEYGPPTVPPIPGASVNVLSGERSEMTTILNGKVRRIASIAYVVEITPEQPGTLAIPEITVTVDGRELRSRATEVQVKKNDAGDLLGVEIFGQPPEVFIGQPLSLVLRISVRPLRDPAEGVLNEVQMWQCINLKESDWGVFEAQVADLARRNAVPRVQQEARDGQVYYIYELAHTLWPPKAGVPDTGGVRVRMTYPLRLQRVQDLFFQPTLRIAESRPLSVAAQAQEIQVLPLPDKGRPASFTGAVGSFTISVTARPPVVGVGDPLTLTLDIADTTPGGSNLETLQAPNLAATAALAKDFRVPSEALSGTVNGTTKRFTVTVRPLRAGVAEVPPIEFSFFDPVQKRYETVRSAPVPITVNPASQMDLSKIVTGDGAAAGAGATAPAARTGTTQLTEVEGGLVANRPVGPALLANHRVALDAATGAALALPPLLTVGALGWRMHRRRHESDAGLARRSRARQQADRRLAAATDAAAVARAVTGFVEDTTGRAEGTLTRGDLARVLADRVPAPLCEQVAALLAECDRARYAGSASEQVAQSLRPKAQAAIDALESAGLRRGKGGAS